MSAFDIMVLIFASCVPIEIALTGIRKCIAESKRSCDNCHGCINYKSKSELINDKKDDI